MSLTSRVHRLMTGPIPSVGSDDWPSRYIWRWICRRSDGRDVGRDRGHDPSPPDRHQRDQARCRPSPSASRVVERAQVVAQRRQDRRRSAPGPRAPTRWTGLSLSRLSAISGKIPVSSNRRNLLGPRRSSDAATHAGSSSTCRRGKPRLAPRGSRPRTGHDPRSATIKSDWTTPGPARSRSRWELRSFVRDDTRRLACVRSPDSPSSQTCTWPDHLTLGLIDVTESPHSDAPG